MSRLSRIKLQVGHLLCHPIVGSFIAMILRNKIPNRGVWIDSTNECVTPYNVASIFWGFHEKSEVQFVRSFLQPDLDVVEIGSSIGVVTMHLIQVQARDRQLICIEANPYLIEAIKRNIEINAPWKQVTILNEALDYSGRKFIGVQIDRNNLGSHIQQPQKGHSVVVKTTTMHDLLRRFRLHEFALVCDAEGAEASMIIEDQGGLAHCRQIIIELHQATHRGQPYSIDDLRGRLETVHGCKLVATRHAVHVFVKS